MALSIHIQNGGPLQTNSFLLADDQTREWVIVDPTAGIEPLFQTARELCAQGFTPRAIWNTHGHFDHVYGNAAWKNEFEVPIFAHSADDEFLEHLPAQSLWFGLSAPATAARDFALDDQKTIQIGQNIAQILHLPGHSRGSVGFHFAELGVLIGGDVLFQNGVGRTDLPGGDPQILAQSLRILWQLPDQTQVWPGHGDATTIGAEKNSNAHAHQLLAQFPA